MNRKCAGNSKVAINMKSTIVAYILWLLLGIFGVHHFYLRRDRHAFVWWATLGGFGIGWLSDFLRLPEYVEEANEEERDNENNEAEIQIQNEARSRRRREVPPKVSLMRFCGMFLLGYIFGTLMQFSWPPEWFEKDQSNRQRPYKVGFGWIGCFLRLVLPFAIAAGVHLVASIGRMQASFRWCLLGSAVGIIWMLDDPSNIGACCFFSSLATWWNGMSWKKHPRKKHRGTFVRITILVPCCTVYFLMWTSALYFNAKITSSYGEDVPLREALQNFFTSPAWKDTKEAFYRIWQHIQTNGWKEFYEHLLNVFDPEGEANAYEVLGVSSSATQEEIKKAYRSLVIEWHPDKQADPEKKQKAEERFRQIQSAYEILSKVRARRARQNKKSAKTTFAQDEF